MTFAPVIPLGGLAGWSFLKRTMPTQAQAFGAQAAIKRDEAYFREKIGGIDTAEELVADARLLRITLSAFGLEADVPNKYFIRKILEGGTLKTDALANRLANKQYQKLASAFGFGDFATPRNKISDFADKLLVQYKSQRFAAAVGEQNNDLRLALNLETQLRDLAGQTMSPKAKWLTVLGSPPLRAVFEQAFGLPKAFGAIDLDRQVKTLETRAQAAFGNSSVEQFSDPDRINDLVRRFLARSDSVGAGAGSQSAQVALTLLQQTSLSMRL
jgi:hypothetical protein